MTIEADLFGICFATADQKEGMGAFVEKRKAQFIGK
jgi:enoyl-CoA hydratase